MRKIFVLTMSLTLLLAMTAPASAGGIVRDAAGSTVYTVTPTCDFPAAEGGLPDCEIDGNGILHLTMSNPGTKTGTFTGTQVFDGTVAIDLLDPNLGFTISGVVTFTGRVQRCGVGTVVSLSSGEGTIDPVTGAATFTRNDQTIVAGGTVQARGVLHETGTETQNPDGTGTLDYDGTYQCERQGRRH